MCTVSTFRRRTVRRLQLAPTAAGPTPAHRLLRTLTDDDRLLRTLTDDDRLLRTPTDDDRVFCTLTDDDRL